MKRFIEMRATGSTLQGTVIKYGKPSLVEGFRESFVPGAFGGQLPDIRLNLQHTDQPVSDAIQWRDSAESLDFVASGVAPGVIRLVERGALRGASVEMRVRDEVREAGTRVIRRAELVGLGVVDRPAHDAPVQVREADLDEFLILGVL